MLRKVSWICETFQQQFIILEGWPPDRAMEYFKREKYVPNGELKAGTTVWHTGGNGPILIWTKPTKRLADRCSFLAHEAVHAAHILLNRRGHVADFNNDEVEAYLVQAIVRVALE